MWTREDLPCKVLRKRVFTKLIRCFLLSGYLNHASPQNLNFPPRGERATAVKPRKVKGIENKSEDTPRHEPLMPQKNILAFLGPLLGQIRLPKVSRARSPSLAGNAMDVCFFESHCGRGGRNAVLPSGDIENTWKARIFKHLWVMNDLGVSFCILCKLPYQEKPTITWSNISILKIPIKSPRKEVEKYLQSTSDYSRTQTLKTKKNISLIWNLSKLKLLFLSKS